MVVIQVSSMAEWKKHLGGSKLVCNLLPLPLIPDP